MLFLCMVQLFKSKLLSRKTKTKLNKTLVEPIVLYVCGAWALSKADEKNLMIFEGKISRRISGPKRNTVNNERERRTNAELKELFNETDVVSVLKNRRLSRAGHVWRVEDRLQ